MKCGCDDSTVKEPFALADLKVQILLQSPDPDAVENELHELDPREDSYWLAQGGRRCAVKNNPGHATFSASQLGSVSTFLVGLRYDSLTRRIDSTWRIKRPRAGLAAAVWQIESAVNWNEQNRWILLRCSLAE